MKVSRILFFVLFFVNVSYGDIVGSERPNNIPEILTSIPENVPDVTKETWQNQKKKPEEQMFADAIIIYHTLFNDEKNIKEWEKYMKIDRDDLKSRQDFLKRLIILISTQGLKITPTPNGIKDLSPWPYNVASSICHGQRILLQVKGLDDSYDLYNLLLTGDMKKTSTIDIKRSKASHGLKFKEQTGMYEELKLSNVVETAQNIVFGLKGKHRGINISLGGIGNAGYSGDIIGPKGANYDPKTKKLLKDKQHGHVYIFKDSVKVKTGNFAALLIGIEGSEPGKTNSMGDTHTNKSAFIDPATLTSITGGDKWKNMVGEENAPSPLGGMRITIDAGQLKHLIKVFNYILGLDEQQQRNLFREILFSGIEVAKEKIDSLMSQKYEGDKSDFPTAKEIFEKKSDPMPITLAYLSYLQWDQKNQFKVYKLMYGLDDWKKTELENYFAAQVQQYKKNDWTLEFLDVEKGLFSNADSPGAVIAHKCSSSTERGASKVCEVKIGFRGTRSLDDWGNNLNFVKTPLRFTDTTINEKKNDKRYQSGQVHEGFLKAYNTVSQKISDIFGGLRSKNSDAKFQIRIGGHGLGGSLATLCAAHIAMKFEDDLKKAKNMIQLETYGSPRTLGEKLSGELTELIGADNILRFVNKDEKGDLDMVTKIPLASILATQFRHVGNECLLTPVGEEIYEGFPKIKVLRTPHRIEGYKAAYWKQNKCGELQQKVSPEKEKSSLLGSLLKRKSHVSSK
jgi:hypothetical protein